MLHLLLKVKRTTGTYYLKAMIIIIVLSCTTSLNSEAQLYLLKYNQGSNNSGQYLEDGQVINLGTFAQGSDGFDIAFEVFNFWGPDAYFDDLNGMSETPGAPVLTFIPDELADSYGIYALERKKFKINFDPTVAGVFSKTFTLGWWIMIDDPEIGYFDEYRSISFTLQGEVTSASGNFAKVMSDDTSNDETLIDVAPNPAKDKIVVSSTFIEGASIIVTNDSGKIMNNCTVVDRTSVRAELLVSNLPAGVYYVRINGKRNLVKRFIKL